MVAPEQNEMFDVLDKQRQHQRQVDRVLKIVLPIVAFLMAVICANMNIWSPIFTLGIFNLGASLFNNLVVNVIYN